MAKTLQQILGYRSLTKLITDAVGGVPTDIIDPKFMSQKPIGISGNVAEVTIMSDNRGTVRLVPYGGPSVRRDLRTIGSKAFKMLHSYEHQVHKAATLVALRSFENEEKQNKGIEYVDRQVLQFAQSLKNTRMTALYSMLTLGKIYADSDGNILPTSSGATLTVDYGVPANNLNQLNSIIAASWATAGTDILGQILALKSAARRISGRPITTAYYGANILGYLAANTSLKNMILGNPGFSQAFAENRVPDNFLGLKWRFAGDAFYEDNNGTNQTWWGGDTITFTPDVDSTWFDNYEGSYLIPDSIGNVGDDASDMLGELTEVQGVFSYATIQDDPPGIKHYHGDTWLPMLNVPSAIFIADVTP